jgi:hypothetical protein
MNKIERKALRAAQKEFEASVEQFLEDHEDRTDAIANGFLDAVDGENALVVIAAAASLIFNLILRRTDIGERIELHRAAVGLLAGMLNSAHDQLDDCEEGQDARH